MTTNSFCVEITIAKTDGTALCLEIDPTDEYIGGGGCATLAVNLKKLFSINKVDELLTFLTDSIVFEDAYLIFEEFNFDYSILFSLQHSFDILHFLRSTQMISLIN